MVGGDKAMERMGVLSRTVLCDHGHVSVVRMIRVRFESNTRKNNSRQLAVAQPGVWTSQGTYRLEGRESGPA